jgi:hypothetical protein
MSEKTLTYPAEVFGVSVDATAEAAVDAAALAPLFDPIAGHALSNIDPGKVIRVVAAGVPFIQAAKAGEDFSGAKGQELQAYLDTVKGSEDLRRGAFMLPGAMAPLKEVLRAIATDGVTPANFGEQVRSILESQKAKKGAADFLGYLAAIGRFPNAQSPNPRSQFRRELSTAVRLGTGSSSNPSAGAIAKNLVDAVNTHVLTDKPETMMPMTRLLTAQILGSKGTSLALAKQKLAATMASPKASELVKAGVPEIMRRLNEALDATDAKPGSISQSTAVRRSVLGAGADMLGSETKAAAEARLAHIGPLLRNLITILPPDKASLERTQNEIKTLFDI